VHFFLCHFDISTPLIDLCKNLFLARSRNQGNVSYKTCHHEKKPNQACHSQVSGLFHLKLMSDWLASLHARSFEDSKV